jgi:nitrate reductase (NAD(P)H)
VRNHGAVPKVDEAALENWRICVHGLVEREKSFGIQDLKDLFPVVTLPITLVCAGNRRKEQNVVLKGLGFNWGAAGGKYGIFVQTLTLTTVISVSTALFTGIYLADILEYVRPLRPQAKHVIFEGADSLPNGPYGTSQRLSWAASREKGMMIGHDSVLTVLILCLTGALKRIAWAMNGLPLEPDHGFPVRIVIPGQIGGRSVKWLNRIEISEKESQHYVRLFFCLPALENIRYKYLLPFCSCISGWVQA